MGRLTSRDGRPTMADVARRAGVSKMTVSRVVNGRPGVSTHTQARVERAIQRLRYVPSDRGRSLAVGRTELLGMLVLDVVSEWVWPLIRGAGEAAEDLGYQVLLRTTGPGEVASLDVRRPPLPSDLLDGLIIVSWRVPLAYARQLVQQGYPVVLIDAFVRLPDVGWVSAQDRDGVRQACRHLIDLGHRRIAFLGGGERPYLARERLAGFLQGMADGRVRVRESWMLQGDFTQASGQQLAARLLRSRSRPSAIVAANDLMAFGVLEAAQGLGLRVPEDLSVVGVDDIASASRTNPALTTVARPYGEMGASAVRILVEAIEAPRPEQRLAQVDLPTRLVVRGSTGPAPEGRDGRRRWNGEGN